jgi:G2/mitotic-specific cyclin 1/2
MRAVLIDWIMEVHNKFHFCLETLFLSVSIMDRFLSRRPCSASKFQLVGLACLFVAAKTEETVACPSAAAFTFMTDEAFDQSDILRAEQYILRALDYSFWAPGPIPFLRHLLRVLPSPPSTINSVAEYLCELSLLDYRWIGLPGSLLAVAAVHLACAIEHHWICKEKGDNVANEKHSSWVRTC